MSSRSFKFSGERTSRQKTGLLRRAVIRGCVFITPKAGDKMESLADLRRGPLGHSDRDRNWKKGTSHFEIAFLPYMRLFSQNSCVNHSLS